jgi:hypothetical protein
MTASVSSTKSSAPRSTPKATSAKKTSAPPKKADAAKKVDAKPKADPTTVAETTKKADAATVAAARADAKRVEDQAKVVALRQTNLAKTTPVKAGIKPAASDATKTVTKSPVERAAETARNADAEKKAKLPGAEKDAAAAKKDVAAKEAELKAAREAKAEADKAVAEKEAALKAAEAAKAKADPTTKGSTQDVVDGTHGEKKAAREVEGAKRAAEAAAKRVQEAERALETSKQEATKADAEVTRLKETSARAHAALAKETQAATAKALTTTDRAERQAITDQLSRAGEVAGVEGSKTMGAAAAAAIAEKGDLSATRQLAGSLQKSIESGNGALFGVRTAEAMKGGLGSGKGAIVGAAAKGIDTVKREFDAAKADAGKHEARFAQFMATHGKSMSPEQKAIAQREFKAAAAKENARLDAAAKKLLSVGQGADAARANGNISGLMADRVGGITKTLDGVRASVPDALGTQAGQAYLKDTLKTTPAGELPTHLVARNDAEAKRLAAPLASAVMGNQDPAARAATLGDVAKHGAQLGMPELQSGEIRAQLEKAANGRSASEIKSALGAFGASLKSIGKTSVSATGGFGAALGLTAAALNLKDASGVKEVAEALTKGGHAVSSIAGDVLENIGKNPSIAKQLASTLGRGAGAFDAINALGALAKGDGVQAGISTASAIGTVLSTVGKQGLRVAGGWLAAGATVAQLGYDVYKSGQERAAYNAQAAKVFEKLGFDKESAAHLGAMRKDSSAVLRELGKGQGPNGTDLSASDVLMRARNLSPEQIRRIAGLSSVLPRDAAGNLDHTPRGILLDGWFGTLNGIRQSMFGAQAA